MKAVVLSDGMVGDVTITKSLDAGLDQEAIAAWKRSSFRPGRRNGEPVALRVDLQTRFTPPVHEQRKLLVLWGVDQEGDERDSCTARLS